MKSQPNYETLVPRRGKREAKGTQPTSPPPPPPLRKLHSKRLQLRWRLTAVAIVVVVAWGMCEAEAIERLKDRRDCKIRTVEVTGRRTGNKMTTICLYDNL